VLTCCDLPPWSYDTEGRMTGVTYPPWSGVSGSNYTYTYDTMGRLTTMTDSLNSVTMVTGVTYGVANEVQAISGSFFNETRSYNSLFQLAQITVPGTLNIQYAYSSTMNNGKVSSQTDVISGEQVVYTYDALNRLATAQTVTNLGVTQWGQSYTFL
jgi:YD repeat-containing protein